MVYCRCGCEFENTHWGDFVTCPNCGRVYANESPNLWHPKTEDERRWICKKCGKLNGNSQGHGYRTECEQCKAPRPYPYD